MDADPFYPYQSRRSVVYGTRGMVACPNPMAAQAGLAILEAGGNASDAATAVSAVLAVVDPSMTGIGGDSFALYFDAATGTVRGLNASGRTPAATTRETVVASLHLPPGTDLATVPLPHTSPHAITVPAGAAGWVDTVEQFGSRRVALADVLTPAIRLAEGGFPVSTLSAHYWAVAEKDLLRNVRPGHKESRKDALLKSVDGQLRAPKEGEMMRLPELAETLRLLADKGKKGFYEGRVAQGIIEACTAAGSLMTLEDLRAHAELPPDINEALAMPVHVGAHVGAHGSQTEDASHRLTLWEHPPNGQGIVALLAMGILGDLERSGAIPPLATLQHNSAEYLHVVVSALCIAFADAGWFVADPVCDSQHGSAFDPERLLDPAYMAQRAALFDAKRALHALQGDPPPRAVAETDDNVPATLSTVDCLKASSRTKLSTSDTVYFAVADADGNGCSYVNSMADLFGSTVVARGCGFALPNRGHMFRLGPENHPNVYAGGKRAYNTIIPAMLTRPVPVPGSDTHTHALDTVFGVMGGFMQPQGHVQVLLNMHAFGMDVQRALDAPRVCVAPNFFWSPDRQAAATGHKKTTADNQLFVEEGIDAAVVAGLREYGYSVADVTSFGRSLFGRGQVIRAVADPGTGERVYAGGSDGRGDGHAVPLF